ncbi:MAG: hypothetical protein L0220_34215, partial [Acidobacteria bacterium]|nr:hypothetical protein [Acidobacteriota bacterium]
NELNRHHYHSRRLSRNPHLRYHQRGLTELPLLSLFCGDKRIAVCACILAVSLLSLGLLGR